MAADVIVEMLHINIYCISFSTEKEFDKASYHFSQYFYVLSIFKLVRVS